MKPFHKLLSVRLVGWSVSGAASHAVFGAITTIVLARGLGPEGLGAYGVFLAVAFLLNQLGSLGLGTAYVRLATPQFQAASEVRTVSWTFFYARGFAVGGLAILALLSGELANRMFAGAGAVRAYLLPGVAAAVLMAVGDHYSEVLRARLAHRSAATVRAVMAAARTLAYLTLLSVDALTVSSAITAAVLLVAVESGTLATLGHRGVQLWPPVRPQLRREWIALSWWLFLTSATTALLTHTDTLLLATLGGSAETGLWVAASRLVSPIPLLVGALWSVVLPISMALTDPGKLERYLAWSGHTAVVSLALAAVGTLIVGPIVTLLFGDSYVSAIAAAQWLLVGFGLNVAAVLYGGLIHRLGLERALAGLSVILLIGNGIGDLVLIPLYGAAGCAAVTTAVMFVGAAWTVWRVERARETLLTEVPPPPNGPERITDGNTMPTEP